MKKSIITISREYGSGGRMIGKMVAEKLGISYYDKEIIAKVAEATGFTEDYIEKNGEYSPSKSIFAYSVVGRDRSGSSMNDYIFSVQRKIILEIAEKGPCVIVGRCADDILADYENSLHVFVYGEAEEKIKGRDVKTSVLKLDRHNYYMMNVVDYLVGNTDRQWGKAQNYDICLNSSAFGYEACADIISEIAK